MSKVIMGIEVSSRVEEAVKVQELLTEYGCFIKTRIGLHDTDEGGRKCSIKGIILLEFVYDADEEIMKLENELGKLKSTKVKKMEF
jgi:hypothetical protein